MSPLRGLTEYGLAGCYNHFNPSGLFGIEKRLAELKQLM